MQRNTAQGSPTRSGNPLPVPPPRQPHARVWEVDALRGLCILLMVVDHALFDLSALPTVFPNFYLVDNPVFTFLSDFAYYDYWMATWRIVLRLGVVALFLLLSGISGTFSHNNLLRAGKLSAAAVALSCITLLIDDIAKADIGILFGILHCLALSVLLYTAVKAWAGAWARWFFLGLGLLLTALALTYDFYFVPLLSKEEALTVGGFLRLVTGAAGYGGDYFGMVPYTGIFLLGAYLGESVYVSRTSLLPKLDGAWHRPLTFVGRRTLWVYLLHQPVLIVVIGLLALLAGYRF